MSCGAGRAVGQGNVWGRETCGSGRAVGQGVAVGPASRGAGRAVGQGELWGRNSCGAGRAVGQGNLWGRTFLIPGSICGAGSPRGVGGRLGVSSPPPIYGAELPHLWGRMSLSMGQNFPIYGADLPSIYGNSFIYGAEPPHLWGRIDLWGRNPLPMGQNLPIYGKSFTYGAEPPPPWGSRPSPPPLWGRTSNPSPSFLCPTASSSPPTLFPLTTCCGAATSRPTAACLVTGYLPEPVTVTWGGASPGDVITYPANRDPATGRYRLVAQLPPTTTMGSHHPRRSHDHESHHPRSSHDHDGFPPPQKVPRPRVPPPQKVSEPPQKVPRPRVPPGPTTPEDTPSANRIVLYVLPPTLVDLYINHEPKLRCLATNLPSDSDLQVSWSKETPGGLQPDLLDLREQFNGTFTATSTVAISSQQWEAGERFTCTVHHRDLPTPLHRSISRSTGKPSPPHVYLFAPHPDEMSQDTLTLTCLVYGFYPVDVQETLDPTTYDTTPPMKEKTGDASYFLYSRLVVARDEWDRGNAYVCMVVHEGLPMKFIQRSVQKNPGKK
uniref:Ig-like domain-containing protein n=1 Tax=Strix occidentalis caurina TaxID=311401 RepID=A0A8D0FPE4_STROC